MAAVETERMPEPLCYLPSMGFSEFLGNAETVTRLRDALTAGRLPHALLLSGPVGAGKYTLALMLARAANCLNPPPGPADYCGACANCVRIGAAAPLRDRVSEAVATREEMRDADKRDTRILIQTHPDVLVVPPDPPQLLIKIGQVRQVIREAHRLPAEGRRSFFIFTSSAFMKEAANSLLKILEEPPAHATLVLLSTNPHELLPTIRSRTAAFTLGRVPADELEPALAARRPQLKAQERLLAARLSDGAPGAAFAFESEAYLESRQAALVLLRGALGQPDYSSLFRTTESFRAGAEGQEKTLALLRALNSLLRDLMLLQAGRRELIGNVDLERELGQLSSVAGFAWIEGAVRSVDTMLAGMRRNLLRSLSLDAMVASFSHAESFDAFDLT